MVSLFLVPFMALDGRRNRSFRVRYRRYMDLFSCHFSGNGFEKYMLLLAAFGIACFTAELARKKSGGWIYIIAF